MFHSTVLRNFNIVQIKCQYGLSIFLLIFLLFENAPWKKKRIFAKMQCCEIGSGHFFYFFKSIDFAKANRKIDRKFYTEQQPETILHKSIEIMVRSYGHSLLRWAHLRIVRYIIRESTVLVERKKTPERYMMIVCAELSSIYMCIYTCEVSV